MQICQNGLWVAVCASSWDYTAAELVCRQLGHSGSNALSILYLLFACTQALFFILYAGSYALREYSGSLQESTVMNSTVIHCYGHEMSLSECFLVKAYECIAKAVVLCTG